MRISEIIYNGDKPKIRQKVSIICDKCNNPHTFPKYTSYISGIEKYNRDLCLGCRRKIQYFNAGESSKNKMKGKTYEELYGKEKSIELRKFKSISATGEKNPMFGRSEHTKGLIKWNKGLKGKTYEEVYGDRSKKMKKNISEKTRGKNNPMYGKPSPMGSGNGWSGWYKGWYFRSFHELSYMINVIERFKFNWESGEKHIYKISYLDENLDYRNYFADFIIEGKYLVEIKPKNLHFSSAVMLKAIAGEKFCRENGLIYKLIDPTKLLSKLELKELIDSKKIELIDRYKEKYKAWQEN